MKFLKFLPLLALLVAVAAFGQQLLNKPSARSTQLRERPLSKFGTVVRVADGDTLTVDFDGKQTKIRLCGIDAPEQQQPLGREAKAALEKLALNREVAVMEIDRDRYGRMVAEVFVTGEPEIFVNGELVQAGLAYHYEKYSKDCINREVIVMTEEIARKSRAGVWADRNAVKPWDYRKAQ